MLRDIHADNPHTRMSDTFISPLTAHTETTCTRTSDMSRRNQKDGTFRTGLLYR